MTIAFKDSSANDAQSSDNVVVTAPTVSDGDVMVYECWWNDNTQTLTVPSGFTEIISENDTTNFLKHSAGWKIASSESGNYTFQLSDSVGGVVAGIGVWSGCHQTTPIDVTGTTTIDTSETSSHTAGGVTTVTDNAMLLYIGAGSWAGTTPEWTPPSGMTERIDHASGNAATEGNITIAELLLGSAGATGNKTGTTSDDTMFSFNTLVALRPASAAATTTDLDVSSLGSLTGVGASQISTESSLSSSANVAFGIQTTASGEESISAVGSISNVGASLVDGNLNVSSSTSLTFDLQLTNDTDINVQSQGLFNSVGQSSTYTTVFTIQSSGSLSPEGASTIDGEFNLQASVTLEAVSESVSTPSTTTQPARGGGGWLRGRKRKEKEKRYDEEEIFLLIQEALPKVLEQYYGNT